MDSNGIVKSYDFLPGEKVTESVDNLFQLYSQLIQPLKDFEGLCGRQDEVNKELKEAKSTIGSAIITPFVMALHFTAILSIPFVILFVIVINVAHTSEGVSLFTAYDEWLQETPFGLWFFDGVIASMIDSGILVGLLGVLLSFVVGCALFPIVAFLLPAMFAVGIVFTVISVFSAKGTIARGNAELKELEGQIDRMFHVLVEPLVFVPPDYRFSAAVEHFVRSYQNGKVSNPKEAMLQFDNYMHQMEMEHKQQQLLESQREIRQKLDAQSAQFKAMEKQIGQIKGKVDWLYWWS